MTVRPLVAFFACRRPDRVQLVFLVLYLVGMAHISFFSLADREPIEARHWLISTWIPLLLPIWLVDGEMNRRRAMRVFVWPESRLAKVLTGYVIAQSFRAIVLVVVLTLLTLNTWLLRDSQASWILLSCGLCGLFVASFVMFWNVLVGSRTVYPGVYAAAVVLLWMFSRLADSRVAVEVAQSLLIPVWLLDPISATELVREPFRVLQGLSASAFWITASCVVLHRSYR